MARKKEEIPLDDIELLNIYNYPESYPRSVLSQVRSNKAAQKRLEELLRDVPPQNRRKKGSKSADDSDASGEAKGTGK
jgi:hypothetical protein